MKQITFILTVLLLTVLCTQNSKAQEYKSSIGVRLGSPLSATFKHFLNEKGAVELTVGTRG